MHCMQGWEQIGNYINMRSKICSNNAQNNDVHSSDRMTNDREYNNVRRPHIIIIITITLPFCSTNWDHPLQGVWRQVQRCPLRRDHVWGMQGGSWWRVLLYSLHNNNWLAGLLSAIPVQCDQLPVSPAEELRGGQSEQEPVPVLPPAEVHGARHVQRWWVLSFCSEQQQPQNKQLINHPNLCSQCSIMIENVLIECDLWK